MHMRLGGRLTDLFRLRGANLSGHIHEHLLAFLRAVLRAAHAATSSAATLCPSTSGLTCVALPSLSGQQP